MGILRAVSSFTVGLILWAIFFGMPSNIYGSVMASFYANPTSEGWMVWCFKAVPIITFFSLIYFFWVGLQDDQSSGGMQ